MIFSPFSEIVLSCETESEGDKPDWIPLLYSYTNGQMGLFTKAGQNWQVAKTSKTLSQER
jgi:hypothetical protein